MPIRSHALARRLHASRTPLNHSASSLRAHKHARRSYASASDGQVQNVAVLGGGITGLATAHYLAKSSSRYNITVYEAGPRLGGWLQSKRVEVPGGSVVFEQGPRTVRWSSAAFITAHLVQDVGLVDQVLYTSKASPAARNRYIYYPDHLVRMPGPGVNVFATARTLLFEPVFSRLLLSFFGEISRPPRDDGVTDESVGSFLRRRLGYADVGDNLASAIMHGIYAGDIYQLSMKSLLPYQWYLEGKYGSVIKGLFAIHQDNNDSVPISKRNAEFLTSFKAERPQLDREFWSKLDAASLFSFKGGLQTLVDGLKKSLEARKNPSVQIRTGTEIARLQKDETSGKIKIFTSDKTPPKTHDMVISTLPARSLAKIAAAGNSAIPPLQDISSVTVIVVNLYFSDPRVLPASGFGYLLPRSISLERNPERALGVIFDSDALGGQDTAPGTKVTVMLGGHWWDTWAPEDIPSAEEGVAMARTVLARHLGIVAEPAATNVSLQRDCIPQYKVGHEDRMRDAHVALKQAFGGRVRVAGNSYTGVGLNDCLRAAREVAYKIGTEGFTTDKTGLEHFAEETRYINMPKSFLV